MSAREAQRLFRAPRPRAAREEAAQRGHPSEDADQRTLEGGTDREPPQRTGEGDPPGELGAPAWSVAKGSACGIAQDLLRGDLRRAEGHRHPFSREGIDRSCGVSEEED